MNEKVYMHAIRCHDNSFNEQVSVFEKILSSGELLSHRLLKDNISYGYNGYDYISLCDYERKNYYPSDSLHYNSFNAYVRYGLSLAFDKEKVEAIKPKIILDAKYNKEGCKHMKELGLSNERYTDYFDEVQVKDRLSLDGLEYVTFPTRSYIKKLLYLTKIHKIDLLINERNKVKKLLELYNHNVDIYDIDSKLLLDDDVVEKLVYKKIDIDFY